MASKFQLFLYTAARISEIEAARRLWTVFSNPLIGPDRFGSTENVEVKFSASGYEAAARLYREHGALFLKGTNQSFVANFSRQSNWLATWAIYLDGAAMSGKHSAKWLAWMLDLCIEFPVLFGYGCSEEEHQAKHMVRKSIPGGGRVTSWEGASMEEFSQVLPGIYWLNIFGSDLTRFFGSDRLASLPHTRYYRVGSTQAAIRLDEPAKASNMEARLASERSVATALGTSFFFDRTVEENKYRLVPALAETIDRLKSDRIDNS